MMEVLPSSPSLSVANDTKRKPRGNKTEINRESIWLGKRIQEQTTV